LLVAALGITPERAKQVSFSDPSATVDQVLYARKELKIAGIDDLLKFKVGVARASAQDITLTKTAPQGTVIQRFDDDPSTLQALLSKQVDAITMSTLMIKEIAKVTSVEPYDIKFRVQRLVHGMAMRQGQDDLLNFVNQFLKTVKKNGELNAIHQKWLGIDFVDVEKPAT
jgi:polar amino acid transport system substrate-binding protein